METIHDRDLSGCDVGNHLRDEERIELRAVLLMCGIVTYLIFEGFDTTDTHTKDNTDTVLVLLLQIHITILNGLLGSNQSQLGIAVHLTGLLTIQIVSNVEVLHLTSKLSLKISCVEKCNRSGTTDSIEQVLPRLFWSVADWRNCAKTCYNYSF